MGVGGKEVAMLKSWKTLCECRIVARDGEIGRAEEFYFDDQRWKVRYLVSHAGVWLFGRKVLIPPSALSEAPRWEERVLSVDLTRDQIGDGPDIDPDRPVSRQMERALHLYYGLPVYWGAMGATPGPGGVLLAQRPLQTADEEDGVHLHSARRLSGWTVAARKGKAGRADGFIFDDRDWTVRYMVVATRDWLPGKKVLVGTDCISDIRPEEQEIRVDLDQAEIERNPPFDVAADIDGRGV